MKLKHTEKFFKNKFLEMKRFARMKGEPFPFKNLNHFISKWEELRGMGVKNIDRVMKYSIQYDTAYFTALKEYQTIKELGIEGDLKFKDIKKMTTTEFAERFEGDIMTMYRQKKSEGMSGKDAGEYISWYWFGSTGDEK